MLFSALKLISTDGPVAAHLREDMYTSRDRKSTRRSTRKQMRGGDFAKRDPRYAGNMLPAPRQFRYFSRISGPFHHLVAIPFHCRTDHSLHSSLF